MNIHFLQHVADEGLGAIDNWTADNHHQLRGTRLFKKEGFPSLDEFEWLFIMGGPMGVYDEKKFPWLKAEKLFIEQAIKSDKTVIGICLGSQLVAEVLGSRIYKGMFKEIGWYPISLTKSARKSPFFQSFKAEEPVFHWHGDTYELPRNTVHLASSKAYPAQAFSYGSNVYGFQFHLEFTQKTVRKLIKTQLSHLDDGPYVQHKKEMLSNPDNFNHDRELLVSFLDALQTK